MTSDKKQDLIAALECRQPSGAVPIWELEFHVWDKISGKHAVLGREFEALPFPEQERALHRNAEIFISVAEELHFAGLTVPGNYWEVGPGQLAYNCLPEGAPVRQIKVLKEMAPPDLMLVAGVGGVMSMPGPEEYVEFSYKIFDAPEEIDRRAERALLGGVETAKKYRDLGIEIVFTASDLADNRGPYFSPPQMDRFVLPYLNQWATQVKALGLYTILHSDGDLMPCLKDIAESGVHGLQAIDPTAGMDMRTVKDLVGKRLCLCGNLDCGLMLTGSPEAVYEKTRGLLLDCKPGGGLVLGASNALQPEVLPENCRAVVKAWQEFGQY